MKYNGRKLKGPRIKIVPILRDEADGGNIFFQVQGVTDLEPFTKICPKPEPPKDILPGNRVRFNVEDKFFVKEFEEWCEKQTHWTAITSLRATPSLEWETVKFDDPSTWKNWQAEMMESGFTNREIAALMNAIMEVNGMNEALVEEARQSFLTGQAAAKNGQGSHQEEQKSTPSGEPAS